MKTTGGYQRLLDASKYSRRGKDNIHSSMLTFPRFLIGMAALSRHSSIHAFLAPMTNTHYRTICKSATSNSLWTQVAIEAARQFTITQRNKLHDLGLLNVSRPIQIIGESLSPICDIGDCVIDRNDNVNTSSRRQNDTKIIHFQRHGQGYHNLICDMYREFSIPIDFDSADPKKNPVVRPEFLDPPLTALGIEQCSSQRELCANLSPECLIVSPMLRCIQTAKLSFRDHDTVPWVSHEGCREELGLLVGNKRRKIEDIRLDYPEIDFSAIPDNEDVPWERYGDRRETLEEKSERIYDFLTEYVRKRPEREMAIVCHSAYLFTLLNAVMDIEEEELKSWFLTSEVRSLRVIFSDSK
jgi:broad specificity phosphatase PhoE